MNIRDLSTVELAVARLDELIQACRKLGPLYTANPKLVAKVTVRAKSLRPVLGALQDFLNEPKGAKP